MPVNLFEKKNVGELLILSTLLNYSTLMASQMNKMSQCKHLLLQCVMSLLLLLSRTYQIMDYWICMAFQRCWKESCLFYQDDPLRKKCPYSELFWSIFCRIQTEYGEYSVRMRENAVHNNSEYGHFLRSGLQ